MCVGRGTLRGACPLRSAEHRVRDAHRLGQGGATPCDPPRILQADAEQGRVVAVFPLACAGTALRNTADGRFLAWNDWRNAVLGQLRGLDLTTGAQFALGPAPSSFESHPSELRLLFPEAPAEDAGVAAVAATLTTGCGVAAPMPSRRSSLASGRA